MKSANLTGPQVPLAKKPFLSSDGMVLAVSFHLPMNSRWLVGSQGRVGGKMETLCTSGNGIRTVRDCADLALVTPCIFLSTLLTNLQLYAMLGNILHVFFIKFSRCIKYTIDACLINVFSLKHGFQQ